MSSKLDEARKIINRVDSQMAELFTERMRAAEMVFEYKKDLTDIVKSQIEFDKCNN